MSNLPTSYSPLSTAITVKSAAQAIEFYKKGDAGRDAAPLGRDGQEIARAQAPIGCKSCFGCFEPDRSSTFEGGYWLARGRGKESVSPECAPGETVSKSGYFFLTTVCLAAAACFFLSSALLAMTCFCVDFFWFDFGDLSPMIFGFLVRVDFPAACQFLRKERHYARQSAHCK